MYHLLSDKECQRPEKFKSADGSSEVGPRRGRGEQLFENGCIYRGEFVDDMFHGQGEFTFPESTRLTGLFENNHFRQGTVVLSVGIRIDCRTETDYETLEDFYKDFQVQLPDDIFFMGRTSNRGQLESAHIARGDKKIASYSGSNLVFKLPGDSRNYLIVSKLWFYIGEILQANGDNHNGPAFDGRGNQVWYSGIGYNNGSRSGGQLNGTQLMLRHCSSLQFFRDMKYQNGKFLSSITIFNNGLIFSTEDDYFKGTLKIFLPRGDEIEYECALNDYANLKLGTLRIPPQRQGEESGEIKFSEKGGRLMFTVKGKDVTLDEFKLMHS